MKYVRLSETNAVIEVLDENPEGKFHPDVVAMFASVADDNVQVGWEVVDGVYKEPLPFELGDLGYKTIPVIDFKLLFTSVERVAIKESTDAIVQDFYSFVEDPRVQNIDCNLATVQDGLAYLETVNILAAGRATEILDSCKRV